MLAAAKKAADYVKKKLGKGRRRRHRQRGGIVAPTRYNPSTGRMEIPRRRRNPFTGHMEYEGYPGIVF